jgi:bacteriochlorophyll 4-vinyl reductase
VSGARPYQIEAMRAISSAWTKVDRTMLVMATGTGKTFVMKRVAELRKKAGRGRALLLAQEPACAYFAATFERVFGAMLGPSLRVTETECEAAGASACVFEVRW